MAKLRIIKRSRKYPDFLYYYAKEYGISLVSRTFKPKRGFTFNYGVSDVYAGGKGFWINHPIAVQRSVDKRLTFKYLEDHGLPVLENTTALTVAQGWQEQGKTVIARLDAKGKKGKGLVVVEPDQPLPMCSLYTAYEKGREIRCHVLLSPFDVSKSFFLVQQKKKRNGWKDNPSFSPIIKSYDHGWIYSVNNINPLICKAKAEAVSTETVKALGLYYAAVDMLVTKEGDFKVIEVNTAPGISAGSVANLYTNYLNHIKTEVKSC